MRATITAKTIPRYFRKLGFRIYNKPMTSRAFGGHSRGGGELHTVAGQGVSHSSNTPFLYRKAGAGVWRGKRGGVFFRDLDSPLFKTSILQIDL